jgi:nucleoside-diphosphate-sugar epimerase
MDIKGKRIAVTGATGFVGSHIALALAAAGAEVIGVVRTPAKGDWMVEHGVRCIPGDLTDKASLVAAFQDIDAVVSNAALGSNQGDMADFERVNCDGIRHVFNATADAGIKRIVHISTVGIYRTRLYRRVGEDGQRYDTEKRRFDWSDFTTDWRYSRTKALAEDIAWERAGAHDLALTTLRPGPVYGSRDHKATASLVASIRDKRVRTAPTVGVPWVHAGDVALATRGALTNDASIGNPYNLTGEPVRMSHFLKTMKRTLYPDGSGGALLIPVPVPVWVRFDTTAAARDLGFIARPIADGLAEALAEYRV